MSKEVRNQSRLEAFANYIVIVVGIMIVVTLIHRLAVSVRHTGKLGRVPGVEQKQPRLRKESITKMEIWSTADYALFVGFSANCQYCLDSLPRLKQLSDRSGTRFPIIILIDGGIDQTLNLLKHRGIVSIQVVSADLSSFGVAGVPSFLIIDKHGDVTFSELGRLDDRRLEALTDRIDQICPNCLLEKAK